ncbi:MAG: hypothetical protein KJ060_21200 [Candidatus Hydrogenedentes bacterium]|nr:hypothetical protein [Candidatus Hydrogenedentota bacterium]
MIETAVILLVTLLLLEGVLRFLGLADPVLYTADETAGYRLKPDQHVTILSNEITINRWGVRDPRTLEGKDSGTRRVLVLGDSVTWGGIREKEANLFTTVAESRLKDTEVINCGVNGYSVTQMVALYHHLTLLNPDFVVVFAIPRDFTRPPVVRLTGTGVAFPDEPPRSALLAAANLARFTAAHRYGWKWLQPGPDVLPERQSTGDTLDENVASVVALAAERPAGTILVVLMPTAEGTKDADRIGDIEKALEADEVSFVNLADHVEISPDLYLDGVHLTTEGHRRAGTTLAEILAPRL